ncbi:phospholipase A2 [Zea mays]|uniref:phospholipase A2 n=1 Tax=Zea mays TaxID=4577 RepID=B6TSQ6_MAIZE|nr:phospholipase A2 [Zea mays]ACG40139.1 phospholipase A2 [Zea mays]|eukprot:NP_001150728.1 phospholipase A2 [Zea mays]
MGGGRELAAGRYFPLQRRRSSSRRRPLLVILLLAVVASGQAPAASGSIFGGDSASSECSRACESQRCTAPLMRYGKYCGVSYTGCPGEAPCDALDACCMLHDACVQATDNDYLNMWCNQSLLDCVAAARPTAMADTFEGNRCNVTDVADEITAIVEAAVYARGILHKP